VVLHPSRVAESSARLKLRLAGLTPREQDVAACVAAGLTTKQVACALDISRHTARHHTERVFEKLGVRGRVAVTLFVLGADGVAASPPLVAAS
jgi:DNA-binding CsgD family transcriptional regulator